MAFHAARFGPLSLHGLGFPMTDRDAGGNVSRQARGRLLRSLTLGTALGLGLLPVGLATLPAQAQSARAQDFNIASQPLNRALRALADQSGVQLAYRTAIASGTVAPAVRGSMTTEQALARLLAGSGLSYSFTNANTVTILGGSAARGGGVAVEGAMALDTIEVQGEDPRGPVDGIIAHRTATGTKTDAPILEIPQSISVVGRTQMERQGATSVTEVLRYVPGVVIETYGPDPKGYDWVLMRGFNAQSSSDFRDGLRQSSISYSFFRTDPYALERVEVLRGPSSSLYGQSDAGGLINKVSKRPRDKAHYQVELQGGSYDRLQGAFDIGGPVDAAGTLLYRVIGIARDSNTQFKYPNGTERADDRLLLAPSFTWRPSADTKLTVYAEVLQDRSGGSALYSRAPGGRWLPVGDPNFDKFKQDQQVVGYEFEHRFNETWTLRQNARYGHTETFLNATQGYWAPAAGAIARRNRTFDESMSAFVSDTQLEAKFGTGPVSHTALFGFDNNFVDADVRGWQTPWGSTLLNPIRPVYGIAMPDPRLVGAPFQIYNQKLAQFGIYAQDQIKWDRWILTLGGRYDRIDVKTDDSLTRRSYERVDGQFSGRVGLTYLTSFGLAPYVSYAEAFVPTLGLDARGQTMEPSQSRQVEVGLKFEPAGWNALFTAALFDLTKTNATVYTTNGAEPLGRTNSKGVELEAKVSLAEGLDFTGSYTFADVEVEVGATAAQRGKRPMLVPAHTASGWLNYTFQQGVLKGLGLGAGVRYVGQSYGDALNTVKIDPWTVVDAGASYKWRNATFAVNATNLFDKKYFATCESATACYEGQRRTVIGRVRFDF